ncbi:MAG: 3-deoxy-7-phosphoheptulonate synthase [Acholeplasma sp.]|nr:3-deoxy-7-phosphoheptulonate synthase [Acholeplasma sp.]
MRKEIKINNELSAGKDFLVIAGPCSVESYEQTLEIATAVKEAGANILRGGAFKPRTSPNSFQGLGEEGVKILARVGKDLSMPIITEIPSEKYIDLFCEYVDIIQVGARNMDNYYLLKELGKTKKPILLKRGMSATLEELVLAAKYITMGGNENVILCERGIRTFEHQTRNTFDISAVLALRKMTELPVFVDPSHAAGTWEMVEGLSLAGLAVGADGLMVEVHHDPDHALSDGAQSLKPKRFKKMMEKITYLKPHLTKVNKNEDNNGKL